MQVVRELKLIDFEFWSGARYLANLLTSEEFETIEEWFECAPEPMSETTVNDAFWFDREFLVTEVLGFSSWDEFEESREDDI